MNIYAAGILAGLIATPVWIIINLLVDYFYLPVIHKHIDQLNEVFMARPALNMLVLTADIALWGVLFGAGYALIYPGLERFGLGGGILWGLFMFLAFSRSNFESMVWTKFPQDLNVFWFVEGLAGLAAWGAAFGFVFSRLIG